MPQVSWEAIFAGQVREIQATFSEAHQAMLNWGAWSRDRGGIFPCLAKMSLWDEADTKKFDDFAEEGETGVSPIPTPQTQIKAEAANDEEADEKLAEAIDCLLHRASFPTIWRKCLGAAYFVRVPEYQFPREAMLIYPRDKRLSCESYLIFFDGAMRAIQKSLCASQI